MRKPTAIFFDLDETLISNTLSPDVLFSTLLDKPTYQLEKAQSKIFLETLFSYVKSTWDTLFESEKDPRQQMINSFANAISTSGIKTLDADTLFDELAKLSAQHTQINNNALKTLVRLREQGIAVGVITNGLAAMQLLKIQRHGLDDLVDEVIVSEYARAHKPSNQVFKFALDKLEIKAEKAWHVGDHVDNDVFGAINSGLTGIFYDPAHKGEAEAFKNKSCKPSRVINDLYELVGLIQ